MSGIVGSLNTRGSGLINIGSATDGQVFTGTGAGLPVGFEAAAGGGKVLQVVQDTLTTQFTTSSTSFTPVTGLSVSITPAVDSKVLLMGNLTACVTVSNSGACCVKRDSTFLHIGDAAGSRQRALSSLRVEAGNNTLSQPLAYLDTHGADGSTAVAYSWQVIAESGSATVFVNSSATDSDSSGYHRYASSIIAIEIGA